jgi:uncharacterized protein YbaR (Trm112 family)
MNKTMMDILACPIDKNHPLELFEIKEKDNVVSEGAHSIQLLRKSQLCFRMNYETKSKK